MKKVLVVALSALLLLAMFIPAMANENPKVITAVSATEVKPGETITVTVSLDQTINTRGMAIDFKDACNSGTFEVVNAAFNSEFAGKCMMAPVNTAKLNATSAATAAFDWTGEVFTLTLKVAENAAFGDYEIKVVVKDVKDANKQNIEVDLVGATVKVTHDCVLADTYNTTDPDFHWKDCTVPGCNVAPAKEA
ncbi:MAG: hypothetical protein IJC26_02665, partial [Clostridia bacterium]|nr:hypothetical protein [Clostridia bacterium]